MTPSRRSVRLATLVASLAVAVPASALQTSIGLQISPVKVEQDLTGDEFGTDLIVRNVGSGPAVVETRVTGLGHDLHGVVTFPDDPAAEAAIDAPRREFRLAAEERIDLPLKGSIPQGRVSTYVAFVAETSTDEASSAGALSSRTRVATTFLIRGPRPWVESVRVDDVGFLSQRAREGPVQIFADVFNEGDVHVRPEGRMEVSYGRGGADDLELSAETILPGYARRFVAEWSPPAGLRGPVTVDVVFDDPAHTSGHELAYPPDLLFDLGIESLTTRKDGSGDLHLDAAVRNSGREALPDISGELVLSDGPGGIEAGPFVAQAERGLEPGGTTVLAFLLDEDIPVGPWTATVTVTSGPVEKVAEARIEFPTVPGHGEPVEATEVPPYRDRGVLLPLALGLLLLALSLVSLVWWLKRRKDDEDGEGDEPARAEPGTTVAE